MAVSIRLRREGAKNRPYFKVVVADSRSPRDGKFIEIIGTYDPKKQGDNSTLKVDRAEYWIARGAQASDTVKSLLKKNKKRSVAGVADADSRSATGATTDAGAETALPPETAAATTESPAATTETAVTAPNE